MIRALIMVGLLGAASTGVVAQIPPVTQTEPRPVMRQLPGMELPWMYAIRYGPRLCDGAICLSAVDVDQDGDEDLDVAFADQSACPKPPIHLRYFQNTLRHRWASNIPARGGAW